MLTELMKRDVTALYFFHLKIEAHYHSLEFLVCEYSVDSPSLGKQSPECNCEPHRKTKRPYL